MTKIVTVSIFPFLLTKGFQIDFLHNYHILALENIHPKMGATKNNKLKPWGIKNYFKN